MGVVQEGGHEAAVYVAHIIQDIFLFRQNLYPVVLTRLAQIHGDDSTPRRIPVGGKIKDGAFIAQEVIGSFAWFK